MFDFISDALAVIALLLAAAVVILMIGAAIFAPEALQSLVGA